MERFTRYENISHITGHIVPTIQELKPVPLPENVWGIDHIVRTHGPEVEIRNVVG